MKKKRTLVTMAIAGCCFSPAYAETYGIPACLLQGQQSNQDVNEILTLSIGSIDESYVTLKKSQPQPAYEVHLKTLFANVADPLLRF